MREQGDTSGGGRPRQSEKILDRGGLLAMRARLKREGLTLVQCHGCFDLVHPGHLRHLRQARSLGDVLLVTITPDEAVGKGIGRPLIPQSLRAESLAALDCVDHVYVNEESSAAALLALATPDIYVKGKEYEANADPRFAHERRIVETAGGRVVCTSGEIVFSSTALIAALERRADPFEGRTSHLGERPDLQPAVLDRIVVSMRGRRVVVVGDVIIDSYILCDRPEVAGESPILTLRPLEARQYDGGAAIVARHAAALGARVTLVTALPPSEQGELLRARLAAEGIVVLAIPSTAPIAEKQRFLSGSHKVMKVDLMHPLVLDGDEMDTLNGLAVDAATAGGGCCDAAIVTDFAQGLFTPASVRELTRSLRPRAGILAGDVSGPRSSLRAMMSPDIVCPCEAELRGAMGLHAEGLPLVTWRLLEETGGSNALVTLGADGLIAFGRLEARPARKDEAWERRLWSEHVPSLAPIALDAMGCGDSLLAAASLALASGGTLMQAAVLGARAAGAHAQRLGNVPIATADLRSGRLHALLGEAVAAPEYSCTPHGTGPTLSLGSTAMTVSA